MEILKKVQILWAQTETKAL